jgi:hypothetical protein
VGELARLNVDQGEHGRAWMARVGGGGDMARAGALGGRARAQHVGASPKRGLCAMEGEKVRVTTAARHQGRAVPSGEAEPGSRSRSGSSVGKAPEQSDVVGGVCTRHGALDGQRASVSYYHILTLFLFLLARFLRRSFSSQHPPFFGCVCLGRRNWSCGPGLRPFEGAQSQALRPLRKAAPSARTPVLILGAARARDWPSGRHSGSARPSQPRTHAIGLSLLRC